MSNFQGGAFFLNINYPAQEYAQQNNNISPKMHINMAKKSLVFEPLNSLKKIVPIQHYFAQWHNRGILLGLVQWYSPRRWNNIFYLFFLPYNQIRFKKIKYCRYIVYMQCKIISQPKTVKVVKIFLL